MWDGIGILCRLDGCVRIRPYRFLSIVSITTWLPYVLQIPSSIVNTIDDCEAEELTLERILIGSSGATFDWSDFPRGSTPCRLAASDADLIRVFRRSRKSTSHLHANLLPLDPSTPRPDFFAMVPRQPEKLEEQTDDLSSDAEQDESSSSSDGASSAGGMENQNGIEMEEEYHTDPEDESADTEDDEFTEGQLQNTAPLLPAELLKPLPSPATSLQQTVLIPREQMTREQKVSQRNRNRKAKKRVWDRLRRDSEGSGVLEAGKVAQAKRGVVSLRRDKLESGRVAKRRKNGEGQVSGRQQLLESRKVDVEERRRGLMRPARDGKKGRKVRRAG